MSLKKEAVRFFSACSEASIATYGAAVAYYTVFSLAPLLIIAVAVASIAFDSADVQALVLGEFSRTFGNDGADLIQSLISSSQSLSSNIISAGIGLILILIGATGVFRALKTGLDTILKSLPDKRVSGIWKKVFKPLVSVGMVFSLGFILIVSLAASALLNAFSGVLIMVAPASLILLTVLNFFVAYVFTSLFLASLFVFLPSERVTWKPALYAGFLAGSFFMLGKYLLSLYFSLTNAATSFGAASSLVLIILWAYYLSLAVFLTAIIMRLYFIPASSRIK